MTSIISLAGFLHFVIVTLAMSATCPCPRLSCCVRRFLTGWKPCAKCFPIGPYRLEPVSVPGVPWSQEAHALRNHAGNAWLLLR